MWIVLANRWISGGDRWKRGGRDSVLIEPLTAAAGRDTATRHVACVDSPHGSATVGTSTLIRSQDEIPGSSMTRKFHPRLQGIQSATGENLTEVAEITDRWKGYCEDLGCDEEGKGIE